MRSTCLLVATATVFMAFAPPIQAAPAGGAGALHAAADRIALTEQAQVAVRYWRGRRYCWYFDGWRGPGWYRCGYSWRYGYGWGGIVGWNGWYYPGYRYGRRHHHRRWDGPRRPRDFDRRGGIYRGRTVTPGPGTPRPVSPGVVGRSRPGAGSGFVGGGRPPAASRSGAPMGAPRGAIGAPAGRGPSGGGAPPAAGRPSRGR